MLAPDDVPEEPDELDAVFDFEIQLLDLTDHQKLMLKPVEERLKNILPPGSLGARVAKNRKRDRKSRWRSKLQGHFAGTSAKKWVKKLQDVGGASRPPGAEHWQGQGRPSGGEEAAHVGIGQEEGQDREERRCQAQEEPSGFRGLRRVRLERQDRQGQ